jgi:hypothetical protein
LGSIFRSYSCATFQVLTKKSVFLNYRRASFGRFSIARKTTFFTSGLSISIRAKNFFSNHSQFKNEQSNVSETIIFDVLNSISQSFNTIIKKPLKKINIPILSIE